MNAARIFSLLIMLCCLGKTQAQDSFENEQARYASLAKPYEDSLTATVNLLGIVKRGYEQRYRLDSLERRVTELKAEKLKLKLALIKSHPGSYEAFELFDHDLLQRAAYAAVFSADSLMAIYNGFSKKIKETPKAKSAYAYLLKKKSLTLGRQMPDFTFTTVDGSTQSLSSFRNNNYVLLCFWNWGCKECIQSIPTFRQIYDEYGNKGLRMFQVSTDSDTLHWKKAMERWPMQWPQVGDFPNYVKGERIRVLYDLAYVPQYFLIDKEGKLIYHNTQMNDDEDYNVLQQILKQLLQ